MSLRGRASVCAIASIYQPPDQEGGSSPKLHLSFKVIWKVRHQPYGPQKRTSAGPNAKIEAYLTPRIYRTYTRCSHCKRNPHQSFQATKGVIGVRRLDQILIRAGSTLPRNGPRHFINTSRLYSPFFNFNFNLYSISFGFNSLTMASNHSVNGYSTASFGPTAPERFDFTPLFEDTLLSIVPSALLLLALPARLLFLRKQPRKVLRSALHSNKLVNSTSSVN